MIFLNSDSSAEALVFYLPCVCTHTDTEAEQRKARVQNILKSSEKTQYLMNTLYHPKQLTSKRVAFKNARTFILKLQLFRLQLTIERVIISKCYNTYTIQYK